MACLEKHDQASCVCQGVLLAAHSHPDAWLQPQVMNDSVGVNIHVHGPLQLFVGVVVVVVAGFAAELVVALVKEEVVVVGWLWWWVVAAAAVMVLLL